MRTGSLLRYSLAALAVVAATAAFPSASHAIVFDLTSDHCTGGCGTAPFGTVDSDPGWGERRYRSGSGEWPTEYRFMGEDGGGRLPRIQI